MIRIGHKVKRTNQFHGNIRCELSRIGLEVTLIRWEVMRTSWFLGGWSHDQDEEFGYINEISSMFDI